MTPSPRSGPSTSRPSARPGSIDSIRIAPAREVLHAEDLEKRLHPFDRASFPSDLDGRRIRDLVAEGIYFDGMDWIAPLLGAPLTTLLDHLPPDAALWLDEPGAIERELDGLEREAERLEPDARAKRGASSAARIALRSASPRARSPQRAAARGSHRGRGDDDCRGHAPDRGQAAALVRPKARSPPRRASPAHHARLRADHRLRQPRPGGPTRRAARRRPRVDRSGSGGRRLRLARGQAGRLHRPRDLRPLPPPRRPPSARLRGRHARPPDAQAGRLRGPPRSRDRGLSRIEANRARRAGDRVRPDRLRVQRPSLRPDPSARHGPALLLGGGADAVHLAPRRHGVAADEGQDAPRHPGHDRGACSASTPRGRRARDTPSRPTRRGSGSWSRPSSTTRRRISSRRSKT